MCVIRTSCQASHSGRIAYNGLSADATPPYRAFLMLAPKESNQWKPACLEFVVYVQVMQSNARSLL